MDIAVIGAGHGGTAVAAYLSMVGSSVRIHDKCAAVVDPLREAGAVRLRGVLGEGIYPLSVASRSLKEVVSGVRLVLVVTPASAHREIAAGMAGLVEDGQVILLHPGRTGGAMEFRQVLRELGCKTRILVAETQTLLYACRKTGPAEVRVLGLKSKVGLAALPASDTTQVMDLVSPLFPQFVPAGDVLETSMMNIGAVFHPAPSLLNAGRIEDTRGGFMYYHQGITPAVARVVERVDAERLEVARALGVASMSAVEWLRETYGVSGCTIYECIQNNRAYAEVKAPDDIHGRYLTEDVPTGLVPLASLGRLAGVKTPVIDALIELASSLHGRDYRSTGRNASALGICGFDRQQLTQVVRGTVEATV